MAHICGERCIKKMRKGIRCETCWNRPSGICNVCSDMLKRLVK